MVDTDNCLNVRRHVLVGEDRRETWQLFCNRFVVFLMFTIRLSPKVTRQNVSSVPRFAAYYTTTFGLHANRLRAEVILRNCFCHLVRNGYFLQDSYEGECDYRGRRAHRAHFTSRPYTVSFPTPRVNCRVCRAVRCQGSGRNRGDECCRAAGRCHNRQALCLNANEDDCNRQRGTR